MATHSSVLAWRIPGTGEPGGLPSMRSHGVRDDWSDLADLAAAVRLWVNYLNFCSLSCFLRKKKGKLSTPHMTVVMIQWDIHKVHLISCLTNIKFLKTIIKAIITLIRIKLLYYHSGNLSTKEIALSFNLKHKNIFNFKWNSKQEYLHSSLLKIF